MDPRQLILINNSIKKNYYSKEDYFISSSNKITYDILIKKKWNHQCMILQGPEKSGKTHLAMLWKRKSDAIIFDSNNIQPEISITRNCLIEDIENFTNEHDLENLLHCYNNAVENKNFLLMTANNLEFSKKLLDLNSRLLSTPIIKIKMPDDELLKVIIYREFYLRQLNIDEKIINFIMKNVERSIESTLNFIELIDKESLKTSKKISLKFLNDIINNI
jgi:chromosomal replication initiation ATPase DnaA